MLSLLIRHADLFTGVAALATCIVFFSDDEHVAVFGVSGGVTNTKDDDGWALTESEPSSSDEHTRSLCAKFKQIQTGYSLIRLK